jgi:hypothetical protein
MVEDTSNMALSLAASGSALSNDTSLQAARESDGIILH